MIYQPAWKISLGKLFSPVEQFEWNIITQHLLKLKWMVKQDFVFLGVYSSIVLIKEAVFQKVFLTSYSCSMWTSDLAIPFILEIWIFHKSISRPYWLDIEMQRTFYEDSFWWINTSAIGCFVIEAVLLQSGFVVL